MKKIIAMLLAVVMVMALAACSNTPANNESTPAATTTTAPAGETTTTGANDAVMTHAEFMAAEADAKVCVETYVQATQGWWDNQLTIYAQNAEGGCFIYNAAVSEEQSKLLVPGTKIRVTGDKAIFNGLHEVMNGTVEIVEGGDTFTAEAQDLTAKLGTDELELYMAQKAAFKGVEVVAANDAGDAFLYNWDGSGSADSDSDLYFKVSVGEQTCTFVIEYYLTGPDSDAYKAVQNLKVGDKIDIECFMYWYEGAQPHCTAVTAAA